MLNIGQKRDDWSGDLLLECFVISTCQQDLREKFTGWRLNQLWPWSKMLANQETTREQNECSKDENVEVMCGKTRKDKIRNGHFWEHLGVAQIDDKIRETELRWFRHVQRKPTMASVRKSFTLQGDGPEGEGVGMKTWMEIVIIDLKKCNPSKDLVYDKSEWRNKIHAADPNIVGTRIWWWWCWHITKNPRGSKIRNFTHFS